MHNLKHNHVLHERNVIVTVDVGDDAAGRGRGRVAIEQLGDSFWRVRLQLRLHGGRRTCPRRWCWRGGEGLRLRDDGTSYFLNRRSFRASPRLRDAALAGRASSSR